MLSVEAFSCTLHVHLSAKHALVHLLVGSVPSGQLTGKVWCSVVHCHAQSTPTVPCIELMNRFSPRETRQPRIPPSFVSSVPCCVSFPTILLSRADKISNYPAIKPGKKNKLSEHHIWIWSEAHNINYSSLCTNINTGSLLCYGCFYTGLTRQHLLCITLKLVVSTFILIISSVILKRFTTTLKILRASIFHVLFAVLCQQRPGTVI